MLSVRRLAVALVLPLMLLLAGGVAPSASAAGGGVTCPPGQFWNDLAAACIISVVVPPTGGGQDRPPTVPIGSDPNTTTPPSGGTGPQKCVSNISGKEIPCTDSLYGGWSNAHNCYVSVAQPPPPQSSPVWQGNTTGAVYSCFNPDLLGTTVAYFWAATSPVATTAPPPPDPRQLAQQAIAVMQLKGITIGIVPKDQPGSVGLVGLPQWMWVQTPTANTWGPITKSASAGGYTVTATGKVDHIVWDMGDGQRITCHGPGTPYTPAAGKAKSPTCGHDYYAKQGTYTVRATSYWVITWSGIGQTGTIPIQVSNTTSITIGESQVINQ